jgi:hypothetical protein
VSAIAPACRNLTSLRISSHHIQELPPLPPQLQQLNLQICIKLQTLPALPPTLVVLDCYSCTSLEQLPSNFSRTAVTMLDCSLCRPLKTLPALSPCLKELFIIGCSRLLHLPALPDSLHNLQVADCSSLSEVSSTEQQLSILYGILQ